MEETSTLVTDGAYLGKKTKSSSCSTNGNGHIYASFQREQCLNCPHKDECRVKVHAKVCSITISAKSQFRAQAKREMKTEEYKQLIAEQRSKQKICEVGNQQEHLFKDRLDLIRLQ